VLHARRPGPRWVGGCWGVTGFFAAALRGVNIPVDSGVFADHSSPRFPSVGLALKHGDDIYTSTLGPSGNRVDVKKIFMSAEEFDRLVLNPEPFCVEGKCHSKEDQARYEQRRREYLLALEVLTDGALMWFTNGREGFDERLTGDYLKPLFTEKERDHHAVRIQAELERIGEGDLKKGLAIVRKRAIAFYAIPDELFGEEE